MNICIFGAGAMGTSLGAALTASGVACDLVTRNRAHVHALQQGGAHLTGCVQANVKVRALLPEEMTLSYDMIFLASGQQSNGELQPLCGFLKQDGILITVQNGLPEEGLAATFGRDRVYGCILSWGAELTEPGTVRVTSRSGYRFAIGAYGNADRLPRLQQLLSRVGRVECGDLSELRFAKLAVNASFSTLSVISGMSFGQLALSRKRQVLALMREVFAVARAEGCKRLPLNGHDVFRVFRRPWGALLLPIAMKDYRNTRSGMLRALALGKKCDIDHVAGAVIKRAERLNVPTPCLRRAVELVHEIENGFAEIAPESLSLLDF